MTEPPKFYMFVSCDPHGRLTNSSKLVVVYNLEIIGSAEVPIEATLPGPRRVRELRSRIAEAARAAGFDIPETLDGNAELHVVNRHEGFWHVHNVSKRPGC